MIKRILTILIVALAFSCQKKSMEKEAETIKRSFESYLPEVDTFLLKKADFYNEIVSNGTLEALQKTQVRFKTGGIIEKLNVKNGQKVKKGRLMARLENTKQNLSLKRVTIDFDNAKIKLSDELVSYTRGKSTDTTEIPAMALKNFYLKSGYRSAELALKEARINLQNTRIRTPFSGRVANLKKKSYDQANAGEVLCLLIDDAEFEVVFSIIEAEISLLKEGQKIEVAPFSFEAQYEAKISSINPQVDKNGLIQVKALVKNTDGRLMEGLNVRITARQVVPDQLVVPKKAVLPRDGRKVVFTYNPEEKMAYWNYVQTMLENTDAYTIKQGGDLKKGEWVIVEGNLNLAHESKVKLIQPQ